MPRPRLHTISYELSWGEAVVSHANINSFPVHVTYIANGKRVELKKVSLPWKTTFKAADGDLLFVATKPQIPHARAETLYAAIDCRISQDGQLLEHLYGTPHLELTPIKVSARVGQPPVSGNLDLKIENFKTSH